MRNVLAWSVLAALVWAQEGQVPTPPPGSDPVPAPIVGPSQNVPLPPIPLAPAGVVEGSTPPAPGAGETAAGVGEFPYWGLVTGTRVRVRGGPADYHAILQEVPQATPVKVQSIEGEWTRIELPGGLGAYVALSAGGKIYVAEGAPGEGVVMVNDLMIRGTPSTQYPPLGRLKVGDRVQILGKQDGFARIVGPASTKAYVASRYVTRAPDQAATGLDFVARQRAAELAVSRGPASAPVAHPGPAISADPLTAKGAPEIRDVPVIAPTNPVVPEVRVVRETAETAPGSASGTKVTTTASSRVTTPSAAFDRFETEQGKRIEERDIPATRALLEALRDGTPTGDPTRVRAEEMLAAVQEWDTTKTSISAARQRLQNAAEEAKSAEQQYAQDLVALRKSREELFDAGGKAKKRPPYLATGFVRRSYPQNEDAIQSGPPFALFQGDNTKRFVLESQRYDLSQYADKLIGVLEGEGPSERSGLLQKVIVVTKLEIIDPGIQ